MEALVGLWSKRHRLGFSAWVLLFKTMAGIVQGSVCYVFRLKTCCRRCLVSVLSALREPQFNKN